MPFSLFSSLFSCCWSFWCWGTSAAPAARSARRFLLRSAVAALLVIAAVRAWRKAAGPSPHPADRRPGPTIQQIRQMAELVTAKVTIADCQETTLSGYLGDVKAVLVVRGDALLGPDLSQARIVSCDESARTLVIELPRPHLISCRLDHTATRLACLSHDGLWAIAPGDAGRTVVLNRAYSEAEKAVAEAAATPETIDQAAGHAVRVLESFFATDGWTVKVQWNIPA